MAEETTTDLTITNLPSLIKEWMSTEDELRTLSAEVKGKRKRAKTIREMIMKIMKGNKVGRLNISAGAVTTRTRSVKAPMTKKFLVGALTDFFEGNTAMAEKCASFLDEHRPLKATDSLTLDPLTSP